MTDMEPANRCPFCGSWRTMRSPPYVTCRDCRKWWDVDEVQEDEKDDR